MQSPIQKVQEKIARMKQRGNNHISDLDEFLEDLIEEERFEFQMAWVDGNKRGWDMSSDFPEHGIQYYNDRFNVKSS